MAKCNFETVLALLSWSFSVARYSLLSVYSGTVQTVSHSSPLDPIPVAVISVTGAAKTWCADIFVLLYLCFVYVYILLYLCFVYVYVYVYVLLCLCLGDIFVLLCLCFVLFFCDDIFVLFHSGVKTRYISYWVNDFTHNGTTATEVPITHRNSGVYSESLAWCAIMHRAVRVTNNIS